MKASELADLLFDKWEQELEKHGSFKDIAMLSTARGAVAGLIRALGDIEVDVRYIAPGKDRDTPER